MSHPAWQKGDLFIRVYVQPNAKQHKLVGLFADHIKVQITSPAVENKANHYLQKWLAKECGTTQANVHLEKGQLSRYKLFRIQSPYVIPDWLQPWLG